MALASTTTLVMEPAVEVVVTLNKTGDLTNTGFGDAEAAVMLMDRGAKITEIHAPFCCALDETPAMIVSEFKFDTPPPIAEVPLPSTVSVDVKAVPPVPIAVSVKLPAPQIEPMAAQDPAVTPVKELVKAVKVVTVPEFVDPTNGAMPVSTPLRV
jgi:hypothetical protein